MFSQQGTVLVIPFLLDRGSLKGFRMADDGTWWKWTAVATILIKSQKRGMTNHMPLCSRG